MMLVLGESLSPTAHAASVIVASARTAGIDALPLLRAVQGMGLRLGPGEFRALVNDESIHIDTVCTLPHVLLFPSSGKSTCGCCQVLFTQDPRSEPSMAAPVPCRFRYQTKEHTCNFC